MDRDVAPSAAGPGSGELDALVVLGCRVREGRPSHALESRLELARLVHQTQLARLAPPSRELGIVLSGGRRWDGAREADVMAEWLVARGVPPAALILEGDSLTTSQNARKVAPVLEAHGFRRIGLVTSDFHMIRAARLFRREGAMVETFSARSNLGFFTKQRLVLRELCALALEPFEPR